MWIPAGFNPRPPHGGRRATWPTVKATSNEFQSTPPARGATSSGLLPRQGNMEFQSTPPHGGRRSLSRLRTIFETFQSTPPHGGRLSMHPPISMLRTFQSTPPHGGRTEPHRRDDADPGVSIHAPRTGGDALTRIARRKVTAFQSTPPHGGATLASRSVQTRVWGVSIHAPARGATTRYAGRLLACRVRFNPRPPHGGRQQDADGARHCLDVSIHAPRTGGDTLVATLRDMTLEFQSTPPHGGRREYVVYPDLIAAVSIHAPARGATSVSYPVVKEREFIWFARTLAKSTCRSNSISCKQA